MTFINRTPTTMKTTPSSPIYDLRFTIYERLRVSLLVWMSLLPLLLAPSSRAAGPPEAMAYQGFLVDANGNPLAPSTPANYPVIFRIFPTTSGGSSLWSEQQIVTVDKGNFSVILSEGTAVGGEPRPPLSTVLSTNGADRYIQISVTIGTTTSDMLPRLRLLPMAYAFLATSANNLVSPSGVPVIKYANNRAEVTGDFFASGGITGSGSGLTGLTAAQIGAGTFADARLSANVALRAGGNAFTGDQTIAGHVGIGGPPLDAALDVEGDMHLNTHDLFLREGADHNHGLAWYGNAKPFAGVVVDGPVLYGFLGGGLGIRNGGEKLALRWDTTGNVGIGTPQPSARLSLVGPGASELLGSVRSSTLLTCAGGLGTSAGNELALASIGFNSGNNSFLGVRAVRTANGSDWLSTAIGLGMDVDNSVRAGGASLWLHANGNVGIGTTTPAAKLEVNGGVRITANNFLELGAGIALKELNAGKIGYQTFTAGALDIVGAGTNQAARKVKIWAEGGTTFTGRVGIGTDTPAVPLDVTGNARLTMTDNGYISGQGNWVGNIYTLVDSPTRVGGEGPEIYGMSGSFGSSGPNNNASYIGSVAIRANGGYIASSMGLVVYSDRRIKRDPQPSEITKDLATIQKLRVTDYRMVDPAEGGNGWRKGFIAQEVEEIIPGAVTRSVEFVPDIFSLSTNVVFNPAAKTLSVSLTKEHGLKTGDRVRLHVDGVRLDAKVSAVPSSHQFVVENCERAPEKVFVYGRQVHDFRTVDYDRIFTTGIGAIQELASKVQALESAQKQIAQLEAAAATAALRHKQEMGELQREVALLKERLAQPSRTDALQSGLDDLRKVVQQLAASRAQPKATAVALEQPSVVPATVADSLARKSVARR